MRGPPAAPDPVEDPAGYREFVLAHLGKDDPTQAQRQMPTLLRELVAEAEGMLRDRPGPNQWSAAEVLAHIVDAELMCAARYRWILAQDEPHLLSYDQDLFVSRVHGIDEDPGELVDLFTALRGANLSLWARTPEGERKRIGIHQERGPESFELSFRLIAGHDRLHHRQAKDAVAHARKLG